MFRSSIRLVVLVLVGVGVLAGPLRADAQTTDPTSPPSTSPSTSPTTSPPTTSPTTPPTIPPSAGPPTTSPTAPSTTPPVTAAEPGTPAPTRTPIDAKALAAAVRLGRIDAQLLTVESALADVQRKRDDILGGIGELDAQIADNRRRAETLTKQVSERAAAVYTRAGSVLAPAKIENREDIQSGTSYVNAANSVDNAALDELVRTRDLMERDRERKVAARDDLDQIRVRLAELQQQLTDLRKDERDLIGEWGLVTVMGASQLNAAQITAWYASTGITPHLPEGITIADLAQLYVSEGELAGVKGDIAFAQSIIETGSFTEFKGYNFSGIGVCDSCTGGYLFDAARDGVRAQMQLLRSYADPKSRAADFSVPLSPVLYSTDPVEGARRFDTFFLKGAAPVWNQMGGGNWATDPSYASKVLRVYARMLAFTFGSS